jgi:predicted alpha/beta superfamily hydrolase
MTARFLALVGFLTAAAGALAQNAAGPVVIGERVQLQSRILKESRSLVVSKPAGYDDGTERYPVLYLLDAETHFHYASGIVNFLGENDRMPKMLVVGVDSEDIAQRTRDLTTPSTVESDNRFSPGGGGAQAFLSFVAGELVPYIEKNYRARPYRLLVGHSFGGLFAVYAMIARTKLFNGYIAADPSLDWNNRALVAQAETFFANSKELQADLYVTAAGGSGEPYAAIRRFASVLGEKAPAGFRWNFESMQQDDHMSIPLPSVYRGLETIFEEWRLPEDCLALYDKGGIEAIHKRFRQAGARFGYAERTTPPFTVSLVVYQLSKAGRLEDAAKVLLHDPANYPPPWNQLDALARAYEKRGDDRQAVRFYQLSLQANPRNEFARKKLIEKGVEVPQP